MRLERFSVIVVLTLTFVSLSGEVLWAHHSVAGYDTQKEVVLRGVVKEFNWRNPHVFVVWEVKDAWEDSLRDWDLRGIPKAMAICRSASLMELRMTR